MGKVASFCGILKVKRKSKLKYSGFLKNAHTHTHKIRYSTQMNTQDRDYSKIEKLKKVTSML